MKRVRLHLTQSKDLQELLYLGLVYIKDLQGFLHSKSMLSFLQRKNLQPKNLLIVVQGTTQELFLHMHVLFCTNLKRP